MFLQQPRKVGRSDHRGLAIWAAVCAEHVLPYFEQDYPDDDRPRLAIEACRAWAKTGLFKMADVRKASLDSHAAARFAESDSPAQFAARAAGQAVATAHVPDHAIGAALYGVKAASRAGVTGENQWQYRRLPKHLRPFIIALAAERPVLGRMLQYLPDGRS